MPAPTRQNTAARIERRSLALTTSQEGAGNDGTSSTYTLASIVADGIDRRQASIPAVCSAAALLARTAHPDARGQHAVTVGINQAADRAEQWAEHHAAPKGGAA